MSRKLRGAPWPEGKVSEAVIAPHHYTWDREEILNDPTPRGLAEFKANIPYKEGDVIWVTVHQKTFRAYIYQVLYERDRFGDRIEVYNILAETAKDQWSRVWQRVWVGYIQKGYMNAGLAPDLVGKL